VNAFSGFGLDDQAVRTPPGDRLDTHDVGGDGMAGAVTKSWSERSCCSQPVARALLRGDEDR
jgi:hypothetical protein